MSAILQVGDRQITAAQIVRQVSRSQLLPQLLREVIIDEILTQWQSSSPAQLVPGDPEFDRCYQQIAAVSIDRGLSEPQLQAVTARTIKLQQFKQANWGHKIGSYYLQRKSQLDRFVYSIMQVTDGTIAQELFFRIYSGEKSFNELAFKYSQGAEAIDGGKTGPINIARVHPTIASQLTILAPGQLSPLFAIENFYTFIRLEKVIPAPFNDELRQFLLDELFEQWLQAKVASEVGSISVPNDLN
jgi:parvulin-like peptidyl-prolyl isomerase